MMLPYSTWLNSSGSIMFYYMFPIKDKAGSGVGVNVNIKDGEISSYRISGNLATKYILGGSEVIIVVDNEELKLLDTLNIYQDAIKWVFLGETYYNPRSDK